MRIHSCGRGVYCRESVGGLVRRPPDLRGDRLQTPGTPDPDADTADLVGRVLLGRFRVERLLGSTHLSNVMLAHDTLLRRRVALKEVRPDGALAGDRRSALLQEARRASQVSDRHIAAIYDVLEIGDNVWIVMEYVEGMTLRKRLQEPFTLEEFWRLSGECLAGLRAAHAKGVIHRDIKPENLMLTQEQEIRILDFGLALRSERYCLNATSGDSTSEVEKAPTPAGTPRYMAPEAFFGWHIDERTDLFSLGIVFYEMLTAHHPFEGGGFDSVVEHIMNGSPKPASQVSAGVPEPLSGVIDRMLARDQAQRFASCEEVAIALADARARAGVAEPASPPPAIPSTPAVPTPTPRPPWFRSRRRLLGLALLAVVATVAWRVLVPPPLPRERLLALLLPATPGGNAEFSAFALGSVELLASRLQRHQDQHGFQLTPFSETRAQRLGTVPDARKLLGANLALVTSFEQTGNSLAARLELREPTHDRLLGVRRIAVAESHPLAFGDSLYRASLALLRLPPRPAGAVPGLGVRGAGTMRLLARGIGRLHAAQSEEDLSRALDDLSRARDDLETASQTEPEAALPRAWLAVAQYRTFQRAKDSKWLARAEASARTAISLDGELADGHRVLGVILNLLKRPGDAVAEFRTACSLDPTRDDAWQGYGWSHKLLGDRAAERAVFVAAVERRPHAFRPRWWLANWETEQGHFEQAVPAYREMIRRAPDFSAGYASLGAMLVQLGEYDRAIDTLHHAVALRPTAEGFTNLGTAYFNTGKLNECVDAYNRAFQYDASEYALWFNLGDAYYWLRGRKDQARDAYLNMVSLGRREMLAGAERGDAPDPMIPANLASVFPRLDQPDSARIYLHQAIAIDSSNVSVQYCAALTHWQIGERSRALDWLERAVAGGYPTAWLRDSPVHREWHAEPRFNALLANAGMASRNTPSQESGGRR